MAQRLGTPASSFFFNQKTASFASELNLVWFYWREQQRAEDPLMGTDLREGR